MIATIFVIKVQCFYNVSSEITVTIQINYAVIVPSYIPTVHLIYVELPIIRFQEF